MLTRATMLLLALVLYGCGDSGRRGGDGDGSGGGDDGSTGLPGIGDDDQEEDDDADGSNPVGGATSSSSGGAEPVEEGVTCAQIWDCYDGCEDTDCTVACHEEGSGPAQEQDNALWECIFVNECGISPT